jgi:N-carbamoylputrescine amidase
MSQGQFTEKFRVGVIQMSCSLDPNENLEKAIWRIREAAAQGAQIVCLQELFRSQYFCREENAELFALAETIPGPTTETLGRIARELRIVIIASLFERRAPGLYHNTAAVIGATGEIEGLYRKMHIPDDPLYFEKFYFTPGDLGFQKFDTPFGPIGVLVCWDQWYPEGARITALKGAGILFYPTAIGWHPAEKEEFGSAQLDAWRTIQRAHAIANGVYVAAVNRVDSKKDLPIPASNSGDLRSLPSRSAKLSLRRPRTRKRSWLPSAILRASTRFGETGRFCATGALTPTLRSRTAGWGDMDMRRQQRFSVLTKTRLAARVLYGASHSSA